MREAYSLAPVEMQPAKSSLLATACRLPQVPDQIHKRVSAPPAHELICNMPLVLGVYLYQREAVAPGWVAPVPVKIPLVNVAGAVRLVAVAHVVCKKATLGKQNKKKSSSAFIMTVCDLKVTLYSEKSASL